MLEELEAPNLSRIGIFAAMPWECRPVVRHLRQARRGKLGGFTIWNARTPKHEFIVMKTGIGPARARQAAAILAEHGPFDMFVSTGCAGGLHAASRPGHLTLATQAFDEQTGEPFAADRSRTEQAFQVASRTGLTVHRGSVMCVEAVLASPASKQSAAARGHVAVEMEGAAIAQCAAAAGIPYLSVRSILDGPETELANGGFVDPDSGGLRPVALAKYLARRPRAIGHFLGMQRMMQSAEHSLDLFFAAWLAALNDSIQLPAKPE